MWRKVFAGKNIQTLLMVNVVISSHNSQQLVGFVLSQEPNSGPDSVETVDLFPALAEGVLGAVQVLPVVQCIDEGSEHDCRGQ